ncbi:hypothetical protein PVIIG_02209 [Plasmodium vivax India VII]|uniref:Uncharacterized protein n=1 Tax=Plasmodium vivax India VII TaxID=1077284 RepID=A0A0J9S5P2_PLAVI|nr:hypothetical protein PVIIG_02209 [Plasmodium vivax India VII]
MKDVKLLLEKLRISRERELEREVRILLELKKLSDGTNKADEQGAANGGSDTNGGSVANCSSGANCPDGYLHYVRKKLNGVRRKTLFEQSYYRNALNCYDHAEHYSKVLKNTPNHLQGGSEPEWKKEIIQREDLLTFFHAYLVRKYCERNFLKCVHNDFVRSITYTSLEKDLFFNFVSASRCVLARCLQKVEVLSVETQNETLAQLLNRCKNVILGVQRELAALQERDKQIAKEQLVVADEETNDLCSSLAKYFPFLDERFGESRHNAHVKELYGVYAFVYVFSNVFYVSSLAVGGAKAGRLSGELSGDEVGETINHVSDDLHRVASHRFSSHRLSAHHFSLYRTLIEQFAGGDFMELNETMLYFLSRGGSSNSDDILHNLNALRKATSLQSDFFAAMGGKQIGGHSQKKDHTNDCTVNQKTNHIAREEHPPLSPCINHFFYIGIDFDKTIIKKDSYSAFFKILEKHYFKQSVRRGKDTLTEEDISFFDSFSLEKMKDKPEPTIQERIEYIHKLGHWFVRKELEILEELKKDQESKAEAYSKSYYYYLNQVDRVHVNYSMLLSYYDVFKDVDVDVLNGLISEHYERFELNDYFLETFLHLLSHKMSNRDSFYFDVITLNLKKQICLYTIRNSLMRLRDGEEEHQPISVQQPPTHEPLPLPAPLPEDYYRTFKKYFRVYYSKTHTYDKRLRKYTGSFEYNRLKIKHEEYQPRRDGSTGGGEDPPQGVIEKVSLCSFYDKTVIKTRVCSLLGQVNHKLSAFIGDSLIDLDAMLHSDVAILVGHNELLISFCRKHNIVIKPLVCAAAKIELLARSRGAISSNGGTTNNDAASCNGTATHGAGNKFAPLTDQRDEQLNDLYDEREKVIYSTESWLEIGIFFFGDL